MTELGQTHDPRALIPGDPAAVRDNATVLQIRAGHAERAGDGLVSIDTGAWTGEAAAAFRDRFSYEPNKWYAAANSLATAADVLTTYAQTLEWAQGRAGEAIRLWDDAAAESQRARSAHDQEVARAQPGQLVASFVDTGDAGRQAARDTLRLARDQVGGAVGAGMTGAATTSLMRHAAGDDAVSPMSGSSPARSVPTKTDRLKEHLTEKDLEGARRELKGEVVKTKSTGQPYDHVDEVRCAQRGLVNRIRQLNRLLGNPNSLEADRAVYQSELSEASRLLDHSEQFVPRVGGG